MTLAECNESIYVTALRHVAPKMGDNDKMQRAFWSYAYDQVKDMVEQDEIEFCCHSMAFCFLHDSGRGEVPALSAK